jgi:hypothetical protein
MPFVHCGWTIGMGSYVYFLKICNLSDRTSHYVSDVFVRAETHVSKFLQLLAKLTVLSASTSCTKCDDFVGPVKSSGYFVSLSLIQCQ